MKTKLLVWKHEEVPTDPIIGVAPVSDPSPAADNSGDPSGDNPANGSVDPNILKEGEHKWLAGVKPEFREALKDFKTPNELTEKYMELSSNAEKLKDAVVVPGEGATEEEVSLFRKSIGIPEKFEDYPDLDVKIPEGSDIDVGQLKKQAFEAGMTGEAFTKFMTQRVSTALNAVVEFQKSVEAKREQALTEAKTKYGENFDSIQAKVKLLETIGGDNYKGLIADKGLDQDGRYTAFMMELATRLTEDNLPSGVKVGTTARKKSQGVFANTPEHNK